MAYDEHLAERINRVLTEKKVAFYEKKMFGGLAFMVNDKMCVGIWKDGLMARVGEEALPTALEREHAEIMTMGGRPMKGYALVGPEGLDLEDDLEHWVDLCLAFNPFAKASKKRKKKS